MRDNYQRCNRCVMDTSVADITFDAQGFCNYCVGFLEKQEKKKINNNLQKQQELDALLKKIKAVGQGKKYDCIVGVSGGADSSYTLHLVKSWGLRPLAVHMDNGWNSELAQNNITHLLNKAKVDFYTHVIDWQEYRALMQAFFDADVIDVELLYDHAMLAVNYQLAAKYGVKYILSGCNFATEGMGVPATWNWFKLDKKNIRALAKRNKVKIKTFPLLGLLRYSYTMFIKKVAWVATLDYIDYDKEKCVRFLEENYDYKPYPYKHYESIFTRFYQGYLLPKKFNVDKRIVHFSTLIMSGQMDRDDALKKLESIPYPSSQDLNEDIEYFLKKMQWTQKDLDNYLARSEIKHQVYGSDKALADLLSRLWKFIRRYKIFNYKGLR